MNMRITEEERKDILSKYVEDTSDELLTYLKRHFPTHEINFDWMKQPAKFIQIEDKTRPLLNNKKYLVGKIFQIIEDEWVSLGEQKIRRTIKKYLDGVSNS
jgi:hypothetical protein